MLLAALLVAASDAYLYLAAPPDRPDLVIMVAGELVAIVAITMRRRAPVTALAIATTTLAAELIVAAMATPAPIVAMLVTVYSVATSVPRLRAITATVVVAVSLGAMLLYRISVDSALVLLVWLAIPWVCSQLVRASRNQVEQLQEVTNRLLRERDARARLAVLEERARVARELHDSVAHAVSVIVLQAGAAEQVLDTAPEAARLAIRAVEDQGRQAHQDLRRLLGLLAYGPSGAPAAPPGLANLDTLLSHLSRAGLPVTLAVSGEAVELPVGLDISAYRIVQEGLTNTLKHAGPVTTAVTIDYAPEALTIEVRDPGGDRAHHTHHDGGHDSGHGLAGMRERVELYGGTLEAGPRADGGFAVRAQIPLHQVVT
jgi:signal transduction histidine kinase